MKELTFQVKFLSDIVLPASSNTEGNIEQLDFIPGSNFLGMVAKEYTQFNDSFNVFHSGRVRFGDATLLVKGVATYKMPLSFFHEKLEKTQLINHHLIRDFSGFKQLKQKRNGYITKDLKEVSIAYNYAQKSAYNKEKRRSEDGTMYGYNAMPAGTLWQFSLKYDALERHDVQRIKNNLVGQKRLGKSKSSQYGRVEIKEITQPSIVESERIVSELLETATTLLYAKSRLALIDAEGNPSYDLKYLIEGLEDHNIVWEKCQLKTSTFTPFNGAMQTKSYERVVINSGSVMVLQNLSKAQLESLNQGVGLYLSEGFGELLINPSFLTHEGWFSLKKSPKARELEKVAITEPVVTFLNNRALRKKEKLDLAWDVDRFIQENRRLYQNISNAQWGSIRAICSGSSDDFRETIRTYISDGKVTWNTQQIEHLLEEGKSRAFIHLLCMQMPKGEAKND